jgi:uncharacterized DUF497 family protein
MHDHSVDLAGSPFGTAMGRACNNNVDTLSGVSEAPEFDWDDANCDHLALHHVSPPEAEQAILDGHAVLLEIQTAREEERIKALGMTATGRILAVIFTFRGTAIRPITAYPATTRLQQLYLERRGR